MLPLQRRASDHWSQIEERLGTDVELRCSGGCMVAETAVQEEELRGEARVGAAGRHPHRGAHRRRGPQTAAVCSPDRVRAASWCPLDGYANPLLITPAYLAAARRLGTSRCTLSPR
ncbi:FAD-dependent oxidoreductase [Streptomyces sp. L7]